MTKPFDVLLEQSRRDQDRFERENERREKRMTDAGNRGDDLSRANFSTWKDYLHKYYTVLLAFLSFIIALRGSGTLEPSTQLTIGAGLLGLSILIGFIGIQWYLYAERKWIYISMQISAIPSAFGERTMLKDDEALNGVSKDSEPIAIWRAKNKQEIGELRARIQTSNNYEQTTVYKNKIKGLKRENRHIKYVGAPFGGWMETVWLLFVLVSSVASFAGLSLLIVEIVQ